jgi:hypothetical protein
LPTTPVIPPCSSGTVFLVSMTNTRTMITPLWPIAASMGPVSDWFTEPTDQVRDVVRPCY